MQPIEDLINKWNYKNWICILRNFKDDRFGYFVELGVLPCGHEHHKFVSAEGIDMLDAMQCADFRGNALKDRWETNSWPTEEK